MLRKDPNRSGRESGSRSSSSSARNGRGATSDRRKTGSGVRSRRRANKDFVLYVEGARDRDILESWARRLDPSLARLVAANTVILGGRQPARAREDFGKRRKQSAKLLGLVVLDRDHHTADDARDVEAVVASEPGLELFVWGHRHIESYLLVPATLRRVLGVDHGDDRVERALASSAGEMSASGEATPLSDQTTSSTSNTMLHAKRLLGAGGLLSEALGVELRAGEIAKAMRAEELHEDIRLLFGRIGSLSGVVAEGPEVVIRPPRI